MMDHDQKGFSAKKGELHLQKLAGFQVGYFPTPEIIRFFWT